MRRLFILLLIGLFLAGCKKKHTPAPVLPPGKAILTSPAKDAVCVTGSIISDTQSSITLAWNASDNTDGGYDVYIKNLLTAATTHESASQNQLTFPLLRNTPYSWYVVSKSTKTTITAQSDTWKFYNAGPPTTSYAPFPADLTSPTFGEQVTAVSSTVTLTWAGSSVDNDISGYDVYFGTDTDLKSTKSTDAATTSTSITVTSGSTYYWKVTTKDNKGNASVSQISQFTVK